MPLSDAATAYQANSPYIFAYFRQQHPSLMRWTALLAGFLPPQTANEASVHCELGFGQGLGLAITAASNLDAQVGVDFMHEQVTQLSTLLSDTTIDNITLHADDFSSFLIKNNQKFQTITLHGVWSWVAPEVRSQLIEIIRRFLVDDGFVYLSHNTLPGRAPLMPIQRLIVQTAAQFSHHDDQGLSAALSVMNSMMPLSHYVQITPELSEWWQSLAQEHPTYLAHEYLCQAWSPMLFSDTAHLLSQAGLGFVCSADALELMPQLHLSDVQQRWLEAIDDGNLRQSYADTLRNVGFRRDIWSKSVQSLSLMHQQQNIVQTDIVLLQPVGALPLVLTGDLGVFELPEDVLLTMLHYIASDHYAPKTVASLWAFLSEQGVTLEFSALKLFLIALTALGYIHPAQTQSDVELVCSRSQLLNQKLCQLAWRDESVQYLVSPLAGCGLQVSRLQQLLLLGRNQTQSVTTSEWARWLLAQRHLASSPFLPELSENALFDWLSSAAEQFAQVRLPLLLAHRAVI